MLENLLLEVEREAALRNHEIVDFAAIYLVKPPQVIVSTKVFLQKNSCNYMKALFKLREMGPARVEFCSDYECGWHRRRSLNQKLRFKKPCGCCVACVQEAKRSTFKPIIVHAPTNHIPG